MNDETIDNYSVAESGGEEFENALEGRAVFFTDLAGLNDSEVAERIAQGKVNGDTDVKTKSVGQIFRENVVTFFNLLFLVLSVIQCFFVDWQGDFLGSISKFGFMALVVINAAIGIFQELRAKRTIDKLSLISAPKVKAMRAGREAEIAVKDIVLDDVIALESGSQICADSFVREGVIEVNESLVTGEPDAIEKHEGDKLLSGSFVVSGKALAQVEHIGKDNFATKISAGAKYFKKPNSEIWRSLMFIVKVMAAIIVPLGITLFCVKYFVQDSGSLNKTVQTVIGSVVGMIPNGLVALCSTVFCVSVVRLSKRKTLAQDLYCVETLARVDVLCLDKTGTITEGTMDLNEVLPLSDMGEEDIKVALKNFTCALEDDNATANAMRAFVKDVEKTADAVATVPFSSQRKWSGASFEGISYIVGAMEFTLPSPPKKLKAKADEMARQGYRVLLMLSSKEVLKDNSLPKKLRPIAMLLITDHIREEAYDTLRFFKKEGVAVKVISGDNPETVRAVAMRAGLDGADAAIDMSTLKSEEEVKAAAEKYTVFGRVLPDQKLTLVNALKAAGHTVAMTGDGVNDVLALKAADCSVAMASGSDAAKNVSSLVLLDSNFASMPKVVAEGRRSINNLERASALYIMKTIYNTLLAILFLFIPTSLPFTTQNLTLMGAVTIGIPSVVLALEPNRDRVTGCFLPKVLTNALPCGITVLIAAVAVVVCNEYILTGLSDAQASQLFIIVVTAVGFMMLIKVCLPFNLVRIAVVLLMIGLFAACYATPFPHDFIASIFGLNRDVTFEMGSAVLIICAALVPVFMLMCFALSKARKRYGEYWDGKFSRLDARLKKRAEGKGGMSASALKARTERKKR